MLKKSILVSLLILLCSLVHASDVDPLALQVCEKTYASFTKQISEDLHNVFLEAGIIGAIEVCAERIAKTGEEYSREPGLRLERITLLTLKQQKRLDSFEARAIQAMHDSLAAGKEIAPEAYEWSGKDSHNGTLVYVKPVTVEPLCLTCHGPSEMVQPEVREIMQNKYHALPSGNKIGEIKGAIVITLELPAGKKIIEKSAEQGTQE